MSSFRTKLPFSPSSFLVQHQDQIWSTGSCFAEHVGLKLTNGKFKVNCNPFGILYNPFSIARAMERILQNRIFEKSELFFHLEQWHSYDHHSAFSHPQAENALNTINQRLQQAHHSLMNANRILLTFGTAWVFKLRENNQIVGNCHKLPGQLFHKERLQVSEIKDEFQPVFQKLKTLNEDLQIILTVSPVRHIRTGLLESQKSKAILLLAIEALQQELDYIHYFPSYELLMDDLRDYRFYEADMIHPNSQAIQYIWEYFQSVYFDTSTKTLCQQIEKIVKASQHRPFHIATNQHQSFLRKQLEKIQLLEHKYSFLDFKKERVIFENQLR